jgi:hypothetical protein
LVAVTEDDTRRIALALGVIGIYNVVIAAMGARTIADDTDLYFNLTSYNRDGRPMSNSTTYTFFRAINMNDLFIDMHNALVGDGAPSAVVTFVGMFSSDIEDITHFVRDTNNRFAILARSHLAANRGNMVYFDPSLVSINPLAFFQGLICLIPDEVFMEINLIDSYLAQQEVVRWCHLFALYINIVNTRMVENDVKKFRGTVLRSFQKIVQGRVDLLENLAIAYDKGAPGTYTPKKIIYEAMLMVRVNNNLELAVKDSFNIVDMFPERFGYTNGLDFGQFPVERIGSTDVYTSTDNISIPFYDVDQEIDAYNINIDVIRRQLTSNMVKLIKSSNLGKLRIHLDFPFGFQIEYNKMTVPIYNNPIPSYINPMEYWDTRGQSKSSLVKFKYILSQDSYSTVRLDELPEYANAVRNWKLLGNNDIINNPYFYNSHPGNSLGGQTLVRFLLNPFILTRPSTVTRTDYSRGEG